MATSAADIGLHKVKQGGWTVVERHQTGAFHSFAGVRGKKESIRREDRAEREVIYGTLRCILDQPWDDDDSRSGGWQANKSWLTVWEPLPNSFSLSLSFRRASGNPSPFSPHSSTGCILLGPPLARLPVCVQENTHDRPTWLDDAGVAPSV